VCVCVSMLLRAGSITNPAKFGRSGWSPEVVASPQCSRYMRDDHWRTFCKFLVRVLLIWKNCCCLLDAAYQSHIREPKRQNHCASYLCQYHIWRYSSQGNSCISLWFLYLHYYPFLDHVDFLDFVQEDLDDFATKFPNRFKVYYVLSQVGLHICFHVTTSYYYYYYYYYYYIQC
jgi:hypothetical protein